jgi:hypothetical protein
MPRIEVLETRRQTVEVSGQEILTQDKVTVRVNISAVSEIADATTARAGLKDVNEYLYRALQIAVRQSLGKRTREQVLAEKTDICLQADCQSAFAAPTRSHIRQTWAYSEAHRSPPTNQVYMNGMQQESPEAQTPYFTPGRVHTHSEWATLATRSPVTEPSKKNNFSCLPIPLEIGRFWVTSRRIPASP